MDQFNSDRPVDEDDVPLEFYLRHYELHCQDNAVLKAEEEECHYCQIRSFSNHKQCPLMIVNTEYDGARLPKNFRFIENFILREGVKYAETEFRSGCECVSDSQCEIAGCDCLSDMAVQPGGDLNKKMIVYHSEGSKKGRLREDFLDSRQPIYECHSACACSSDCPNRVVERGRTVPLQVFRTSDGRGWGVRSTVDIKVGQFVDKYIGEVITADEAIYRRDKSLIAQQKDVYLFALDKFSDPDSADERLRGPSLEVDGEYASGPTRFINHSCEPNLRIFARVGDSADKHLHDLAFFAIEEIEAGTELTFDYVDGHEDGIDDSKDPLKVKDMTRCLCGSSNCRRYLW